MSGFTIPTVEPASIMAGEDWHWQITTTDYPPSDGWALTYHIRGIDSLDITATPDLTNNWFDVSALAATTARLRDGRYQWVAKVTKTPETHIFRSGVLTVLPNFVTAKAGMLQDSDEALLEAVDAKISGRISDEGLIEQYTIHGRTVVKMRMSELLDLRGKLRALVRRKRFPGTVGNLVEVKFGPTL